MSENVHFWDFEQLLRGLHHKSRERWTLNPGSVFQRPVFRLELRRCRERKAARGRGARGASSSRVVPFLQLPAEAPGVLVVVEPVQSAPRCQWPPCCLPPLHSSAARPRRRHTVPTLMAGLRAARLRVGPEPGPNGAGQAGAAARPSRRWDPTQNQRTAPARDHHVHPGVDVHSSARAKSPSGGHPGSRVRRK